MHDDPLSEFFQRLRNNKNKNKQFSPKTYDKKKTITEEVNDKVTKIAYD